MTAEPTPHEQKVAAIRRATWVGLAVNLLLAGTKLAGGVVGSSQALVADAVHSLSDLVTDLALILGVRYWSAPADDRHPHGHGRIETLVTMLIGLSLASVAIGLGFEAARAIGETGPRTPRAIALIAALVSIASKELLFRWTRVRARHLGSSALLANAWHHRSDALSSLPVALAVAVSLLAPEWWFVDPLGAVVVCVFILHAAWRILQPALGELVDEAAPEPVRRQLETLAMEVEGVRSARGLRTRYSGDELRVDVRIQVDGGLTVTEGHHIAHRVRRRLMEDGPRVADVMVHVEPHREAPSD